MRPNTRTTYRNRTFTGPAVCVQPTSGTIHSTIQVSGTGFPPGDSVRIYVGTRYIGAIYAVRRRMIVSEDGTFELEFALSDMWPDDLPLPDDFIVIAGVAGRGSIEAGELFFIEPEHTYSADYYAPTVANLAAVG